jgi:hypothetical protein
VRIKRSIRNGFLLDIKEYLLGKKCIIALYGIKNCLIKNYFCSVNLFTIAQYNLHINDKYVGKKFFKDDFNLCTHFVGQFFKFYLNI